MPNQAHFKLIKSQLIAEYQMQVNEYVHIKTGAKVVDLQNDDTNKTFVISFATPSFGHTGVAHILEHSVLCGSKNYPVKELFGELAKGSLNTFLNAMTAKDHTFYPFATMNKADYYNLQRAYLDSTLFPIISEKMFLQEGRHLEYDKATDKLSYKGVVYNEMKGVYSNPESHIEEEVMKALFPDTIYALDSGGNPASIPELTYEQFREFHQNHYHPSNSTTVFYGDDHSDTKFEILNEYFEQFERSKIDILSKDYVIPEDRKTVTDSILSLQKPFETRKVATIYYPEKDKAAVIFGFGNEIMTDRQNFLELDILNQLLVGKSSSPLRKALEESNLGEEFYGDSEIDPSYQIGIFNGLKGVKPENIAQVSELYQQTLANIAVAGFSEQSLQAVLNRYEFDLAEMDFGYGMLPKGLRLSEKVVDNLMFGGEVIPVIEYKAYLQNIKDKLSQNPAFFVELLKSKFVNNQFSVIVNFLPKPDMLEELSTIENHKLAKIRENLDESELNKIIATQEVLTAWQQTPDSAEVLATIPALELADLESKIKPNIIQIISPQLTLVEINTNGVCYANLAFEISKVPQNLLPLLSIFSQVLGQFETRDYSIEVLQNQLDIATGGLSFDVIVTTSNNSLSGNQLVTKLIVNTKFLPSNASEAFDLTTQIIHYTKFDNQTKFLQLISKIKSSISSNLIPSGSRVMLNYLNQGMSVENYLNNQLKGYTQMKYLEDLEIKATNSWQEVLADLENLQNCIFDADNLLLNITCDRVNFDLIENNLNDFNKNLNTNNLPTQSWNFGLNSTNRDLDLPAQVGYAVQSYKLNAEFTGAYHVVKNYLSMDYLWNSVRIQGGAYGCSCVYNSVTNVFSLASYRDPNCSRTLGIYDQIADNLATINLDQEQFKKLIIGAIADLETYLTPEEQGYNELLKLLTGKTGNYRQSIKSQVLGASIEDFRNLSVAIKNAESTKIRGVLGKK